MPTPSTEEYLDEWRKIREIIAEKMRADLRPAFVEPPPKYVMDIFYPAHFRRDYYVADVVN